MPKPESVYDVAVIGAGAVGGAVARELARYRLRIVCLEKANDVGCGASKANTGIVHSAYVAHPGSLKAALCAEGNLAFDGLGRDLGFAVQRPGALVLAFDDAELAVLERLRADGRANGARGLRLLGAAAARRGEAALNPAVRGALLAPDAGRVIPYEYVVGLWESAVASGVELRLRHELSGVERESGGYRLRARDGAAPGGPRGIELRARFVVNAAGTRSAAVAAMNGPAGFAILPVKGQYLVFRRDYESPVRRILFQVPGAAGKGILVTETVYGNLMVGPDALEAADADDLSTDPDSLRAVLAAARRTAPGIDVRRAIRSFAGVRAKPDNGDFNIGLDGGFLTLGGIESPGLTASPAIARAAVRLLAGAGLELAANPRFSGFRAPIVQPGKDMAALAALAPAEAERRIALPPGAPDRLVCRCERVPEARIRDALGRGLPVVSLDAVKRRTRAGQGQCQGGFCGRRTADLLAGELGEEAAAISWEGPGAPPPPERVAGAALRGLES